MEILRTSSARARQGGFTLIELMVVVTIIGLMAAMSITSFRGYGQEARLNEAKPYLLEIGSKMRSYKARHGVYCCSGDTLNETIMSSGLNLDLDGTGNFCFAVICRDGAICAGTTATNFVAASETGDLATEFEVWAILRRTATTTVSGPQGTICTMSATKQNATQWVQPSTSGDAGREGQVAVFRYPAPINGPDTVAGQDGINFNWVEGVSTNHALTP